MEGGAGAEDRLGVGVGAGVGVGMRMGGTGPTAGGAGLTELASTATDLCALTVTLSIKQELATYSSVVKTGEKKRQEEL